MSHTEIYARLDDLRRSLNALTEQHNEILRQLGEQNLRTRFIMQHVRTRRRVSELIDPATGQPEVAMSTMWIDYMSGMRETFLDQISAELAAFERELAHDEAAPVGDSNGATQAGAPADAPASHDSDDPDAPDTRSDRLYH